MSSLRDLIWYRTVTTLQWNSSITKKSGASSFVGATIKANSASYVIQPNAIISDPWLKGEIEHIAILNGETTKIPVNLWFFRGSNYWGTGPSTDRAIDFESFTTTMNAGRPGNWVLPMSGLHVPYQDTEGKFQFYLGLQNTTNISITGKKIIVEFAFRPQDRMY